MQPGAFPAGMIPEPELRAITGDAFNRSAQSAMELVIVIGIEQVMLAVVLVMQNNLHASQGCFQA